MGGHRAAQGLGKVAHAGLRRRQCGMARQRLGLGHAFAELVQRGVGVVPEQHLIQFRLEVGAAAVGDLRLDAFEPEGHHGAAAVEGADLPVPGVAAGAGTRAAQRFFLRQGLEEQAHVDV